VRLDPLFLYLTEGQEVIEVKGENVGQCLDSLQTSFPGLKSELLNRQGQLWDDIGVYLNNSSTYLNHPVKDGDELTILKALAGG